MRHRFVTDETRSAASSRYRYFNSGRNPVQNQPDVAHIEFKYPNLIAPSWSSRPKVLPQLRGVASDAQPLVPRGETSSTSAVLLSRSKARRQPYT